MMLEMPLEEMEGPGRLLGIRAMTRKLRVVHDIQVPRDVVNAAMYDLDPDALQERQPCTRDKRKRGQFVTRGVNWTWSLDGHNKLMGFENWTFPLGVYGCYDTASRKVMFLKVWTSNSSPLLVGILIIFSKQRKYLPSFVLIEVLKPVY